MVAAQPVLVSLHLSHGYAARLVRELSALQLRRTQRSRFPVSVWVITALRLAGWLALRAADVFISRGIVGDVRQTLAGVV